MLDRKSLQRGMVVRERDGKRVGTVRLLGDENFEVRHGLLPVRHYLLSYGDIESVEDGELVLHPGRAGLRQGTLGFSDHEPPSTIKPVAVESQLHAHAGVPMDHWEGLGTGPAPAAPDEPHKGAPPESDGTVRHA